MFRCSESSYFTLVKTGQRTVPNVFIKGEDERLAVWFFLANASQYKLKELMLVEVTIHSPRKGAAGCKNC